MIGNKFYSILFYHVVPRRPSRLKGMRDEMKCEIVVSNNERKSVYVRVLKSRPIVLWTVTFTYLIASVNISIALIFFPHVSVNIISRVKTCRKEATSHIHIHRLFIQNWILRFQDTLKASPKDFNISPESREHVFGCCVSKISLRYYAHQRKMWRSLIRTGADVTIHRARSAARLEPMPHRQSCQCSVFSRVKGNSESRLVCSANRELTEAL